MLTLCQNLVVGRRASSAWINCGTSSRIDIRGTLTGLVVIRARTLILDLQPANTLLQVVFPAIRFHYGLFSGVLPALEPLRRFADHFCGQADPQAIRVAGGFRIKMTLLLRSFLQLLDPLLHGVALRRVLTTLLTRSWLLFLLRGPRLISPNTEAGLRTILLVPLRSVSSGRLALHCDLVPKIRISYRFAF